MFHPTRYIGQVIAISALSALCGCTEPVFEKLFSTDHFDYYIEQGAEPPCEGTGEWLERYYQANVKFLGVELPAEEKIRYHRIYSDFAREWAGCPDARGCADGTSIYTTRPIHAHEIVHANASLLGSPPLLFNEGLAEVLSCRPDGTAIDRFNASAPLEDLVESSAYALQREDFPAKVYPTSASFVRFMLNRFGREPFLRFYARAPQGASYDETCAIFRKEFGEDLDEVFAEWRKDPPTQPGEVCLGMMECDASIPIFVNGLAELGCGPSGELHSSNQALLRFQINEGEIKQVAATPEILEPQPISFVSFLRCSGGNVMGLNDFVTGFRFDRERGHYVDPMRPSRRFVLDVPPGDYMARFSADEKTKIQMELIPSSSPLRGSCTSDAEPLMLRANEDVVLTSRWMERPCNGFWCPGQSWDLAVGPTGGTIHISMYRMSAEVLPDQIYLCSDPCATEAAQCETLTQDYYEDQPLGTFRSKQEFAPGTVVYIGAPLAPTKEHFSVRMMLVPPCNGRKPCVDPWHGPR